MFSPIPCGDKDRLMDIGKSFRVAMEERKTPRLWHVDAGGHEWQI
jgi:hypothetical protein